MHLIDARLWLLDALQLVRTAAFVEDRHLARRLGQLAYGAIRISLRQRRVKRRGVLTEYRARLLGDAVVGRRVELLRLTTNAQLVRPESLHLVEAGALEPSPGGRQRRWWKLPLVVDLFRPVVHLVRLGGHGLSGHCCTCRLHRRRWRRRRRRRRRRRLKSVSPQPHGSCYAPCALHAPASMASAARPCR